MRGLVKLIESHYLSTPSAFRRMDLARIAQYFTMDVITDLAFGHAFGFTIKNEDVHDYIATVRSMLPAMNFFSVYPGLHGILRSQFMKNYVLPSESDPTGLGKVIGFVCSLHLLSVLNLTSCKVLPKVWLRKDSHLIKKTTATC